MNIINYDNYVIYYNCNYKDHISFFMKDISAIKVFHTKEINKYTISIKRAANYKDLIRNLDEKFNNVFVHNSGMNRNYLHFFSYKNIIVNVCNYIIRYFELENFS